MNIRLSIEDLNAVSQRFSQAGDEMEQLINRVESDINQLPTFWEGKTTQAFIDQFQVHKRQLVAAREFFQGMASQINSAVTNSQSLDEDMANQLRS